MAPPPNGPKFFLLALLTLAVVGMMGYASINRYLRPSSVYGRTSRRFQIIADLDNITRIALNVEQDSVRLEVELRRLRELATKYTDIFQESRRNYSCLGKRCPAKSRRSTTTEKRVVTTAPKVKSTESTERTTRMLETFTGNSADKLVLAKT